MLNRYYRYRYLVFWEIRYVIPISSKISTNNFESYVEFQYYDEIIYGVFTNVRYRKYFGVKCNIGLPRVHD